MEEHVTRALQRHDYQPLQRLISVFWAQNNNAINYLDRSKKFDETRFRCVLSFDVSFLSVCLSSICTLHYVLTFARCDAMIINVVCSNITINHIQPNKSIDPDDPRYDARVVRYMIDRLLNRSHTIGDEHEHEHRVKNEVVFALAEALRYV